jgi:hypothetical protein
MGRWTNWDTAEQLFLDEQRDKQQQRQNLRAKTGRGGSKTGTKKSIMPFESMSKAEQKQYTQAGEMRVYRMMITVAQFKELDKTKRTEYLQELIKTKSKNEIAKEWGSVAYHYLQQAGLHEPQKLDAPRMTKKKRTAIALEEERQQLAAEKEKFEQEVLETAKEANRLVKSMRNELDVSKQSFIQSLDTQKKYFLQQQEHMKDELLKEMQNAINIITKDQAEEIQQLKAYAGSMDDMYCKLIEQIDNQQKEITALRSELHQTQTVIEDQKKDIEYYSDELTKLSDVHNKNFKRAEDKFDKLESLNSLSYGAPANNNNELSSKLKTLEVDVNLLKQLAIR